MNNDNLIKEIKVIPIQVKGTNWDQSTVLIKIIDKAGRFGIGESDGPPSAVKEFLEMDTAHGWQMNINDILVGKDPIEFVANYNAMYESQIWVGRRGLGINAISGVDMALYDLAGKQHNVPAYKLLGGAQREGAVPYATLYPSIDTNAPYDELLDEYKRITDKAKEIGFTAVKYAIMPNDYLSDNVLVRFITDLRDYLGYEMDMMVDFLYRWSDPYDAITTLKKLEKVELYFAEAVLQHDDLVGHKLIVEKCNTRICGAEMAGTRWAIKDWIDNAKVPIVQPDINRCGGLTEIRKIAEYAEMQGVQVLPHGWKTGISAAAGIHFHLAVKNAKYFEFLHPDLYDSGLRQNLLLNEPVLENGVFKKNNKPGLGIELNEEYLKGILK